jgi:hypothetical protein
VTPCFLIRFIELVGASAAVALVPCWVSSVDEARDS